MTPSQASLLILQTAKGPLPEHLEQRGSSLISSHPPYRDLLYREAFDRAKARGRAMLMFDLIEARDVLVLADLHRRCAA